MLALNGLQVLQDTKRGACLFKAIMRVTRGSSLTSLLESLLMIEKFLEVNIGALL